MMGRFAFDKSGVRKIENMLKHQITAVQKKTVAAAYDYLANFSYKATTGGGHGTPGGWTWNYVVNWNVSINELSEKINTFPDRDQVSMEQGVFADFLDPKRAITVCASLNYGDSVFVTNSVPYGGVLNDGGEYGAHIFVPNRFLEGCLAHVAGKMDEIIKGVNKECPSL